VNVGARLCEPQAALQISHPLPFSPRCAKSARGLAHSKTLRAFRQPSSNAPASWTAVGLHRFSFGPSRDTVSRSTSSDLQAHTGAKSLVPGSYDIHHPPPAIKTSLLNATRHAGCLFPRRHRLRRSRTIWRTLGRQLIPDFIGRRPQTSITGPWRSGPPGCCFLRSVTTNATHAVQVGNMSMNGMNSTRNVGKSNG
jgi:hypothetical protein